MSTITLTAVGNTLDVAAIRLAGVKGGLPKAVYQAGKRSAEHLNTEAKRRVRERYAIKAGDVTKGTIKAGSDGFTVLWTGSKISLSKFNGSTRSGSFQMGKRAVIPKRDGWITYHPGNEAKGHVLNSTAAQKLTGTFGATFASGHSGIFERTGGITGTGGDKIEEKMGLSVPQMVGNDAIRDEIGEAAAEKFDERMLVEVNRLLGL